MYLIYLRLIHNDASLLTDGLDIKVHVESAIPVGDFKRFMATVHAGGLRELRLFLSMISESKFIKGFQIANLRGSRHKAVALITGYVELGGITEVMLRHAYLFDEWQFNGEEHWVALTNDPEGLIDGVEGRASLLSRSIVDAGDWFRRLYSTELTARELGVLRLAYESGYLNIGYRGVKARQLASRLGVSKVTFLVELDRAIRKVVLREILTHYHGFTWNHQEDEHEHSMLGHEADS